MNMELFKEIAAKCNGPLIDGCLIEIETLRHQLAEKDAEIERLKTENRDACIGLNDYFGPQLAASQAREQQLREALEDANDFVERYSNRWDGINGKHPYTVVEASRQALALPQDTAALEVMIAEAGELMRERCSGSAQTEMDEQNLGSAHWHAARACREAIRDSPCVTLEDLQ